MNQKANKIETCEELMNALESNSYLKTLIERGDLTISFYDVPDFWICAEITYTPGVMGGFNGNVAREIFSVLPYNTHTYFEMVNNKVVMSIGNLDRTVAEE